MSLLIIFIIINIQHLQNVYKPMKYQKNYFYRISRFDEIIQCYIIKPKNLFNNKIEKFQKQ